MSWTPEGRIDGQMPTLVCDGGAESDARETSERSGVVLVADDDVAFAEAVELWLSREWEVVLATDGHETVEKYGPHVDVVLLDRRMPTMSGDEALPKLRAQEGEARIAMMTAVDPDWDIVEMDFDMYLTKPLNQDELLGAVEKLFARAQYAREVQALFSLSSKIGTLQSRYSADELEADQRYQRLEDELDRLHGQSRSQLTGLDGDEFKELMQIVDETP